MLQYLEDNDSDIFILLLKIPGNYTSYQGMLSNLSLVSKQFIFFISNFIFFKPTAMSSEKLKASYDINRNYNTNLGWGGEHMHGSKSIRMDQRKHIVNFVIAQLLEGLATSQYLYNPKTTS